MEEPTLITVEIDGKTTTIPQKSDKDVFDQIVEGLSEVNKLTNEALTEIINEPKPE